MKDDAKKKKEKKERAPERTFAEPISERELRAARAAFAKAGAEAERKIEAATLDQRAELLESYHSESLISIRAYWKAREEIIRSRAQNEIDAIDEQIDELETLRGEAKDEFGKEKAAIEADPKEQNKAIAINNALIKLKTEQARIDAQLVKLLGERTSLETQLGTAISANTDAATVDLQTLDQQIVSINSHLAETKGDVQGAFAIRRLELEKEIIQLRAAGNEEAAQALQKQLDLEQLLVDLEDNSLHLQRQELQMSIAEQQVQNDIASGKISEFEGEKELARIRERSNALLLETLRRMLMVAQAAGKVSEALEIEDKIKKLEGPTRRSRVWLNGSIRFLRMRSVVSLMHS